MFETEVEGLPCDACLFCRGLWIDSLSLEAILRKRVGSTGHDALTPLLQGKDSSETGRTCPRCEKTLRGSTFDGLTIDWCASCRGIFLEAGELGKITDGRRRERRLRRQAEAKEIVTWLFDRADEALELLDRQRSPAAHRDSPEEVLERQREAFFETHGEPRPVRDEPSDRTAKDDGTGSAKPTYAGAFFLGWFASRWAVVMLGIPEPHWVSRWVVLGAGIVLTAIGLWLESPRRTPLARVALYVAQASGIMLFLEPLTMVRKLHVGPGTAIAAGAGAICLILATVLLRRVPRRAPANVP
jgi:hypothetical protein